MGDAEGQGRLEGQTFFLDENHSGNPHLHKAFAMAGVRYEKHQDHFLRGTADAEWIPVAARHNWAVLTADTRIRFNHLERRALIEHRLRLFYFSRNDFGGPEMGRILTKALPKMLFICRKEKPPFAASIDRNGNVRLREVPLQG